MVSVAQKLASVHAQSPVSPPLRSQASKKISSAGWRTRRRLGLRQSSGALQKLAPHRTLPVVSRHARATHALAHAPAHQLSERGTCFLTASTLHKAHHFRGDDRLRVLHRGLLTVARDFGWQLEAWAVFSNHYHFIAHSPPDVPDASNLPDMLSVLHVKTSGWVNRLDRTPGRQVWFNFRETRLTFQRSYLARLNYVHQNPVKHGLVPVASQYPWCSAAWFERESSAAMVKSIYRFKVDRIQVPDDFDTAPDW
jgi:putative transposase